MDNLLLLLLGLFGSACGDMMCAELRRQQLWCLIVLPVVHNSLERARELRIWIVAIDGVIEELALRDHIGLLLACGGELVLSAMFAARG